MYVGRAGEGHALERRAVRVPRFCEGARAGRGVQRVVSVLRKEDDGSKTGESREDGGQAGKDILKERAVSQRQRKPRCMGGALLLTSVIEPLTACSANFVIELRPEGMVSSEDRTMSVGSARCEMILRESSGPFDEEITWIVVCNTSRLSDHGCTRHKSISRICLPGTTHASVGGDAVTHRKEGKASIGSVTPAVKVPQKIAARRLDCSVNQLANVASKSQDAVSFVSLNGAPSRTWAVGPLRRKVSSVSLCILCRADRSCSKNAGGRSPFRLASRKLISPISHVRV